MMLPVKKRVEPDGRIAIGEMLNLKMDKRIKNNRNPK